MDCPWQSLRQAPLSFCEEPLCAWVKQPGNVWSNLGFLIAGILIYKKSMKSGRPVLSWLGLVSILLGIGSAFYHATGSYWGGVSDYAGMFLITGAMTAFNTGRWLQLSLEKLRWVFLGTTLVLLSLSILFPDSARALYVLGAPCCLIEFGLFFRDGKKIHYNSYFLSWVAASLGALAWWLDEGKVICDPQNHVLSLHAVWHLLMAFSLYLLFIYYSQFAELFQKQRGPGIPGPL